LEVSTPCRCSALSFRPASALITRTGPRLVACAAEVVLDDPSRPQKIAFTQSLVSSRAANLRPVATCAPNCGCDSLIRLLSSSVALGAWFLTGARGLVLLLLPDELIFATCCVPPCFLVYSPSIPHQVTSRQASCVV